MADKANRGDGDRLEREINEILNKIEQFPNAESRRTRARKRALRRLGNAIAERQRLLVRYISRISVSQVMLVAFLMILGAFFFRRFNPAVTQWVLYAGIVLLVTSFGIMVFSRRSRPSSPAAYWRGREISYDRPSFGTRLKRWLNGKRTRT